MMKQLTKIMVLLVIIFTSTTVMAAEINVRVKGMVCSLCAQGIEKNFSKFEAVKKVEVSLKEKNVKILLQDDQQLQDDLVKKVITEAGYNIANIERS